MLRRVVLISFVLFPLVQTDLQAQLGKSKIDIQNQFFGIKYVYEDQEYMRLNQMKDILLAKGDPDVQRHFNRYKKNQVLAPTFIFLGYTGFMFGVASAFSSSEGEGFVIGTVGGLTLFIMGITKIPKISFHARQAVAFYNSSKAPIMDNGKLVSGLNNLTVPINLKLVSIPIGN